MNMVTETKHLDYGDKLVDFYNSIDWGWLFDFVREKYGVGMVQHPEAKMNKNGRIYAKSRAKSTVYPGNIQTVSVWRGYTRAGDSVGAPKCTVEVCIHTGDDLADNVILPAELLNVTVFDKKEDAEKELAYLNANMNTMTFSEQRQRENKNNATVFGIA